MKVTTNHITLLAGLPLAIVLTFFAGCEQSGNIGGLDLPAGQPAFDGRLGTPASSFRFQDPVQILGGEGPVSVEAPGYACPTIADVDGDGADDLVVGQFANGQMKFYRNENEPGQTPKFAAGEWIKTGGEVAEVPGVW